MKLHEPIQKLIKEHFKILLTNLFKVLDKPPGLTSLDAFSDPPLELGIDLADPLTTKKLHRAVIKPSVYRKLITLRMDFIKAQAERQGLFKKLEEDADKG